MAEMIVLSTPSASSTIACVKCLYSFRLSINHSKVVVVGDLFILITNLNLDDVTVCTFHPSNFLTLFQDHFLFPFFFFQYLFLVL